MTNHTDIQKLLSAYCGGDLDPAELRRVEDHLAGCASCRAELADLQTALRLIRTTPESEPPPWLATRIMARVREQQQQKRSWLQRIFFPLHIKLPIEVAALLMVCVSGYYLARTVETELQQPLGRQELPAASRETGKPVEAPQEESPAALPSTPVLPRSAEKPTLPPKTDIPAAPAAPGTVDQGAPQQVPAAQGKPSPQPAFTPAPPTIKEEQGTPAVESPYGFTRSYELGQSEKSAQKAKKAKKAATKMEQAADGAAGHDMATPEAVRGATSSGAGVAVPRITIRLAMSAPASAPGSLKEAVTRSGGSVVDDGLVRPNTIKARIPSLRINELLELLTRLGTVVERPQTRDSAGMVEIEITW